MNVLDTFQLKGRRALITGSSAGIGLALAEALAQAGAHVILNGRTASKVAAAAQALQAQGLSVSSAVFDVTDADDKIRAVLDQLPGVAYSFTQPIDMRVSEMIIGVRGDVAIKVFGPDLDTLNRLATQVESLLKNVEGNQDVYTVQNDGVQYLRVIVDRLAVGRYGLSVEDIQDALRTQIEGMRAGTVIEDGRRTPVIIRGPEMVRLSPALAPIAQAVAGPASCRAKSMVRRPSAGSNARGV